MSKSELNPEELRKKSYKELARDLNIPEYRASLLKSALNPNHYPIITDHDLSTEEMMNETGFSKNYIYLLRGALIKVGLDERRSPSQDKVLSFIKCNPSTYKEIARGTGKTLKYVYNIMQTLRAKGKAQSVSIKFGRRDSQFHSDQLVGGISCRSIAYLPGEESWLGLKVAEHIPDELTPGMKKSLTYRLERILPKEAFEVAYKLYA